MSISSHQNGDPRNLGDVKPRISEESNDKSKIWKLTEINEPSQCRTLKLVENPRVNKVCYLLQIYQTPFIEITVTKSDCNFAFLSNLIFNCPIKRAWHVSTSIFVCHPLMFVTAWSRFSSICKSFGGTIVLYQSQVACNNDL